jgi:hypothetical protein
MLQSFVCTLLVWLIQGGFVTPVLHNYISLSTSNPQLQTVYNFTFVLPSGLPIDGNIQITFPSESYNAGLATSPSAYQVYLSDISITNLVNLSDHTFTFKLGTLIAAGTQLNVSFNSLYNPSKSGGTGNFRITTYDN